MPSSVFLIRHIFLLILNPMFPLIIVPLKFYYISPSLLILSKQHINRLKSLLYYNKQTKLPPPYIPLYIMPSSSLLLQSPGFKTDSTSALLIYFQTHSILDALPTGPLKMLHIKVTFMLESKVLILIDLCNNLTLWYNLLELPLDGHLLQGLLFLCSQNHSLLRVPLRFCFKPLHTVHTLLSNPLVHSPVVLIW